MTLRERFNQVMHFQKIDRIPFFEFGYWNETLPTWHEQGLPKEIDNEAKAYEYFGIENWTNVPVRTGLFPAFEYKVLEETEEHIVYLDGEKVKAEVQKKGYKTIPHYLEFPIKKREDWIEFKERLDPRTPNRYPENWNALVEKYKKREYPLGIHFGSMIGKVRDWIGFENLAYMVYDNRALVEEIIETLCVLSISSMERALKDIEFDFASGWEDICYNSGPLISPKMFNEIVTPRYKRITDLLHRCGIDVIWTDCDGNIISLIPEFLEGGINCMFPIEVRAGSDPVKMREMFGKKVLMMGGVDKMVLLKGFDAIEKELLRLKPVVEQGGFIPHVDHRVPADVTLENYKFYLKLKREIFKAGHKKPQYKE